MSKKARSARGDVVDFDLLAIKQQLATAPIPVGVDDRRRFIDEKDGIRTKQTQTVSAFAIAEESLSASEEASDE